MRQRILWLTSDTQTREKRVNKMETSGLSEAELLKMQEEMFASAREKYHTGPEESA